MAYSGRGKPTPLVQGRGRASANDTRLSADISPRYQTSGARSKAGYSLRSRNIRFSGRNSFWNRVLALDLRAIIILVLGLLLLVALVLGASSLIKGCSASRAPEEELDERIGEGTDPELARELVSALDDADALRTIAANANKYEDPRLVRLALDEMGARSMVANYLESEHIAGSFSANPSKGEVLPLVCWDDSWAVLDYAGSAFAVTGSGPCSVSMAYMALTGNSDRTPDSIAELVSNAGATAGESDMAPGFITDYAQDLSLVAHFYEPSSDNLLAVLDENSYVLCEVKAGTLTHGRHSDRAHWVLVGQGEGDSVRVWDPTTSELQGTLVEATELAGAANSLYAVRASESTGD